MALNPIDAVIMGIVSQWVGKECEIDLPILFISGNLLFKGALPIAILWYLWFRKKETFEFLTPDRLEVIKILLASLLALFFGRLLALLLPFRERPIHNPEVNFPIACGLDPGVLHGWSAFPSDHAIMFSALSVGILFASRSLGIVSIFHTVVIVLFPRIFLGLHYPTDVLAGAFIGFAITFVVFKSHVAKIPCRLAERIYNFNSGLFYAGFFLFTLELASLLEHSRAFYDFVMFVFRDWVLPK